MSTDFNNFIPNNLVDTGSDGYTITDVSDGLKKVNITGTTDGDGLVMIGNGFQSYTPATPPPYVAVNARNELLNGTLKKGEKSVQCASCGDWVPESKATKVKGRVLCTINKCALEVRRV